MEPEPAGLAVGVFALLGLFNNAVDCFSYVQVGRDLGASYVTCQIKLSNAQLRFTRWGEAVGLLRGIQHESQLDHDTLAQNFDENKVREVKTRISHIIHLFAEAEHVSQKYKPRVSVSDTGVHSEDDREALELAQQVRDMSLKRQNKNSVLQKASWALYRADAFKNLLGGLADEVKDLEELFPAVETARQQLASKEVDSLSVPAQLILLNESATSEEVQDQLLAAVLERKLAQTTGDSATNFNNLFGKNNQGLQLGHYDIVNAVAFSPDGKTVASGSRDKTIRLWDVVAGKERQKLEGHGKWVNAVAFSPDGKTVASGSADFTVRLWYVAMGIERQKLGDRNDQNNINRLKFKGHRSWVNAVAFSSDGKTVASGSGDSTVRLWDVTTGKEKQKLEGHHSLVNAVAFSSDGKTVASGSGDSTVRLWDAATGAERQKLDGHKDYVKAVAFSPDGKTVASGSKDKTVRLWDVATGEERQKLEGHESRVNAVDFSPDGNTVASGSEDRTVRLWDVATGRERQKLEGHYSWVNAVAFSPDGKMVASGSADFAIRLWDVATGMERQRLDGNDSYAKAVALTSALSGRKVTPPDTTTGGERLESEGYGSVTSTNIGISKAISQIGAQPNLAAETAETQHQSVVTQSLFSEGLNGLYRAAASWCRPKICNGFSRLEWNCCCGQQFWGDFKHTEKDHLSRLTTRLKNNGFTVKVNTASNATATSNTKIDQGGATVKSNSNLSIPKKTTDTAELQVSQKIEPTTTVSQTSFQDSAMPVYLELCINRSSKTTRLGEIMLVPAQGEPLVRNDTQLFVKIRNKYAEHKRKGLLAFLYRPKDIQFVRFGYQIAAGQTDIYQPPGAIPPCEEVREQRYHYSECPLQALPPMPRQTFYQYFHRHEPDCASRSTLFCDRLPKKLGASITTATGVDNLVFGWGVHIIEGPNKPVLASSVAIILGVSFVVSVLYDVCTGNKDSGFAIGQWIVAVLSAVLAAVYFHLQEL